MCFASQPCDALGPSSRLTLPTSSPPLPPTTYSGAPGFDCVLGNAAVYYPMLKDPNKFRIGFHMAGAGALNANRMGSEVGGPAVPCRAAATHECPAFAAYFPALHGSYPPIACHPHAIPLPMMRLQLLDQPSDLTGEKLCAEANPIIPWTIPFHCMMLWTGTVLSVKQNTSMLVWKFPSTCTGIPFTCIHRQVSHTVLNLEFSHCSPPFIPVSHRSQLRSPHRHLSPRTALRRALA